MTTVFVTQEMPWDFSDAEQYGAVEFLTADDLHNVKGSLHNERLLSSLRHKLKSFDPEQDWLLITGSPFISAAVFLLLGHRGLRYVPILRWNNRDRRYIPLHMQLPRNGDDNGTDDREV